jgi:AcrR family transcriptional regulator
VTVPAPGVRKERQEQTRRRLLAAAGRVFARHGYDGASVPAIAEEAGVSTGAIYSNFSGKEELFLELLRQVAVAGAAQRRDHLEEQTEPADALGAMTRDWVDTVDREPDTVRLMMEFWLYAVRRPEVLELVAGLLAEVRGGFAAALDQLGGLDARTRDDLAADLQALAYGFALQRLTEPATATPERFERAVRRLLVGAR